MRFRIIPIIAIAGAVFGGSFAAASRHAVSVPHPYLVKDLNTTPLGSDPDGFTAVNGRVVFEAQDAVDHEHLWTTDGTAAGTHMLDVQSGAWLQIVRAGNKAYLP